MVRRRNLDHFSFSCTHGTIIFALLAHAAQAVTLKSSRAAIGAQHLGQKEPVYLNQTLASVWSLLHSDASGLPANWTDARNHSANATAAAQPATAGGHLAADSLRLHGVTNLHAEAGMSAGNASSGTAQQPTHLKAQANEVFQRQARVYFLFLAVDKVSNLDVWRAFFAEAPVDQYRAFVHCKLPQCTASVAGSPLIAVPTVPSYYCTDLVSPMNQLLSVALSSDLGSTNRNDRFVFVSDSSLPAKPFWHIYSTLTTRQGSDFCVFPSREWADVRGSFGIDIAVKHHQWVTLSREHAERASGLWASGLLHDFMQRYQMNVLGWSANDNNFADQRNFGCLDEFWYMATLYGPLAHELSGNSQSVYLPAFTSGPLQIHAQTGWQGMCDTFVLWSQYVNPYGGSAFDRLLASLDQASQPNSGNVARPGWWDKISSNGIAAIRASEFLFVRKFVDGPALTDVRPLPGGFKEAYTRLVFGR